MDRINAPDVPELPVFGHAAVAGDTIYVSGMLGATDDLAGMVPGGIGPETTQASGSSSGSSRRAGRRSPTW